MVGFEHTSYTVTEGESVMICVQIISPADIGNAEVFLQVTSGGVPAGKTEASK